MKIEKADLVKFMGDAERMLLDNGFRRTCEEDHTCYEWKKLTPLGELLVDVCNDYPVLSYCVYGRMKGRVGKLSFKGLDSGAVLSEVKEFITHNMFKDNENTKTN